jgi:hypothetical protein
MPVLSPPPPLRNVRALLILQVEAAVTALDTILDEYRVFLAYAPNL